jgi:hypothetical protein
MAAPNAAVPAIRGTNSSGGRCCHEVFVKIDYLLVVNGMVAHAVLSASSRCSTSWEWEVAAADVHHSRADQKEHTP